MRKNTFISVCLSLALGVCAEAAVAQTASVTLTEMGGDVAIEQANPASIGQAHLANPRALASSVRVQVAPPDVQMLANARTASLRRAQGMPLQVGLGLRNARPDIDLTGLNWVDLPDGRHVAQFPIASRGAGGLRAAIRLETNGGRVPDGVVMHFVGSGANVFEATGEDFAPGQLFWTPAVEGDSLTVELVLPRDSHPGEFQLSVPQVSYFAASPYKAGYSDGFGSSGSCENDVVCSTNSGKAAYDNATKAVAKMLFTDSADGGSYICTGTLLNNSNSPKRQLFWSAAHCIADQATASSLQTIWFYNTTQCHGSASSINSAVTVLTGGANLLHRNATYDTLLLELKKTPPAGVFYQGWNSTSIVNNSSTTDIHHPAGDAKKYSLGTVGAVNANYSGRSRMTKVNWTSSVTEGGSSGSGLLTIATDGSYQLRGGLFGGPSSCSASSANKNDYFSDFGGVYSQIASYFSP